MTDPIRQRIVELTPQDKWRVILADKEPVTLADVLRAIDKAGGRIYVREDGSFYSDKDEPLDIHYTGAHWDLTKSLDDQTEETCAFIGKLIGIV